MKIEDSVPKMTPRIIANENERMESPPRMKMASNTISVVTEVLMAQLPATRQLLKMDNLQVFHDEQTGEVNAWLRLDTRSSIAPYQQLSNLLGIINQCFAINEITSRPQSL